MIGHRGLKRRDVLAVLGGIAIFAPLRTRAEQRKVPRIGVLVPANPDTFRIPFEEGLARLGYVPGRNILIEFRSADGQPDRLAVLAAELVRMKVDVLVAWQTPAAHAAKDATREIPIAISSADPVGTSLVASLARPGGNITGMSGMTAELGEKTLDLLREIVPSLRRVAILANAADPFTKSFLAQFEAGGRALGIALKTIPVRGADEFVDAFGEISQWGADAVIVQPSLPRRPALALIGKHRLPSISADRRFAANGGLMSFAANQRRLYGEVAVYVDKILKGAKPGDLPVQQPTHFELAINLKTAKTLGLDVPPRTARPRRRGHRMMSRDRGSVLRRDEAGAAALGVMRAQG